MIARLLKLVPLETLLRAGAMALLSHRKAILSKVEGWITHAQKSIKDPAGKFDYVKGRVLSELKLKAGWMVDTGIQMLVGWFKLRFPDAKFEGPAGADPYLGTR